MLTLLLEELQKKYFIQKSSELNFQKKWQVSKVSKAQLKATGAIGKTSFSANSFYRVVFYDPIKHFSMKKSKN